MKIEDYFIPNAAQELVIEARKEHLNSVSGPWDGKYNKFYWLDHGAFVFVRPRRWGKTAVMRYLAERAKNKVLYILPSMLMGNAWTKEASYLIKGCASTLKEIDACSDNYDLFLDDFFIFSSLFNEEIFYRKWKSITICGTLR